MNIYPASASDTFSLTSDTLSYPAFSYPFASAPSLRRHPAHRTTAELPAGVAAYPFLSYPSVQFPAYPFASPRPEATAAPGSYPFSKSAVQTASQGYGAFNFRFDATAAMLGDKPVTGVRDGQPLRAIHVGPCMLRGGSEQMLIALARSLDPSRVRLEKCLVGLPHLIDPAVAADVGVPVEIATPESVQAAIRETDVLLFWGLPIGQWLGESRPGLCVYIAHGEADWTRQTLEMCASAIDHVVAVSRRVAERICPDVPHSVVYNGIDTMHLARTRGRAEIRAELGFDDTDFVIGYVGRFSAEKRPQLVLDAVARLPRSFKALLVGWGDMEDGLLHRANRTLPGRYAFRVAGGHLGDYYQAMDAVCLVSEHEGFGLVLAEAMMCGRPVIATRVGIAPEWIEDRITGLLVDGNATAIAEAARLLQRHPDWAAALAAEGRALADTHGHARRMARQYEDLLERLWLEKSGRRAPV